MTNPRRRLQSIAYYNPPIQNQQSIQNYQTNMGYMVPQAQPIVGNTRFLESPQLAQQPLIQQPSILRRVTGEIYNSNINQVNSIPNNAGRQ